MQNENEVDVDDFLEHYGVKGMKWGKRKARPTSDDIKSARAKVAVQERAINAQADKLNATRNGSHEQKTEAKALGKMQMDYLKNPDRATALRMTNGEKVALGLFAGVGVATGFAVPVAVGGAVGVGVRTAVRKSIEKQTSQTANR